jgi:3-oxoacyl-[acyl-carrier protein] reductase
VYSKVVAITGANGGLGYSLARRFARDGCTLVIIARDAKKLECAKTEIINSYPEVEVLSLKCDIRDEIEVTNTISEIEIKFGRIDLLINNASIRTASPVMDISLQMWRDSVDTNLTGTFLVTKFSLPLLKKSSRPIIINISSIRGIIGRGNISAYSVSKFGVIGFTQSLAEELRDDKIIVYSICPAAIDTDMIRNVKHNIPMEKLIQPDELADIICEIDANQLEPSGQTIIVAGRQKELLNEIAEGNQYKIIQWD